MSRINGRKLGVWSLRLDAAYCLVLGVFVAVTAPQIVTVVELPLPLLFATGVVVAIWSGLVLWMVSRLQIRLALKLVMGVNIVATALIAAASLTAATSVIVIAVLAIALEVALFAVSQAIAIRTLNSPQGLPTVA
ncbi:hypothetical protein ACFYXM_13190 [Streptomyces sp. NPDC002476]|uniref:hypothetical protein n=1 Tax=Streptomyces sp. NPDC002476 TaxID=3364648 RepID=UPI003696A7AD